MLQNVQEFQSLTQNKPVLSLLAKRVIRVQQSLTNLAISKSLRHLKAMIANFCQGVCSQLSLEVFHRSLSSLCQSTSSGVVRSWLAVILKRL